MTFAETTPAGKVKAKSKENKIYKQLLDMLKFLLDTSDNHIGGGDFMTEQQKEKKTVSIWLATELLEQIDQERGYLSRSAWITSQLQNALKKEKAK